MNESTVNYHCTEGNSDKVYQLKLIADGDGFRVLTQYGPRGGRQTQGEKTNGIAVPLDVATKIFEKEHKARLAKGYRITGEAVPDMVGITSKRDSGVRPQLLNPIERDDAESYLLDPAWMAQIKHNGERCLIRVRPGEIEGINRKGQVRPLPAEVVQAIWNVTPPPHSLIDGELLGSQFAPFDLLEWGGECLRHLPAEERHARLQVYVGVKGTSLLLTNAALTSDAKRSLLKQAEAEGMEGIVFKRKDAPYSEGRPNSGGPAMKLKFVESATVRVRAISPGKRSVSMEVKDGHGEWVCVGNCTIPPNHAIPVTGVLIEVNYLYFTGQGGALYQPVYCGERHDLDSVDCSLAQLKLHRQGKAAA